MLKNNLRENNIKKFYEILSNLAYFDKHSNDDFNLFHNIQCIENTLNSIYQVERYIYLLFISIFKKRRAINIYNNNIYQSVPNFIFFLYIYVYILKIVKTIDLYPTLFNMVMDTH